MNRQLRRTAAALLALGMVAAGCSGGETAVETTSTTAPPVDTTMPPPTTAPTTTTVPEPTTTTTTLPPLPNATLAEEGDRNETVEAFQFLLNCYGLDDEAYKKIYADYKPDLVGVSCLFSSLHNQMLRAARLAKEVDPETITVVGGPHPSALPPLLPFLPPRVLASYYPCHAITQYKFLW